ncbi:MAG TPA: translocation/assembly module TamB domain-containing protein, partial [Bacteroidota bacterium]|nr:translocation/assembly module TamB domain-containing protein [Bacteroidota bacterium]
RMIDYSVDASNLDLDGLKYLLSNEELGEQRKAFAGIARVHATARGTVASPVIAATVHADNVSFRTLPFGGVGAELHYERGQIDCHARVTEMGAGADSPPIMTIDGNIPAELGAETRPEGGADSSMNLHVVSHGVQMSVLDPLLPTFNDLVGLMTCDLTLGGTLRHPSYRGTIGIAQCSFLFVPNNISYTLEGTFHPEGERIQVTDCVIRNVPADESGGRKGIVHLGGDFALRNLRPGEFNLTAQGQLLVVKETTEKSSLAVSGNLFVEIGPGPLHFTGEIENSLLKGSLLVRNSSLVFPPTQTTVQEESAQSVPVVTVNDTARPALRRNDRSAAVRYFAQATSAQGGAEQTELHKRKSFMDGLHYDLDIEATGGTTEIRMLFNPATNEELVASFDGRFTITGDGRRWTGDLTIARAYYNFFKRFDATGSIRYTGDFLDPELNIVATYQGSRTLADTTGKTVEKVVVTATITGTRTKPKLEFSMTINDVDYATYNGPKSKDLQSDAIAFIVAGTFPLTTGQKNDLATEFSQTAGLSLLTGATSLLTGRLSQFLKEQTGFIDQVDITTGTRESTELRLSGTAFSGYWHYGGTILNDPLANANISILYSLGTVFDNPALRNLMFELERRVELGTLGLTNDLKRTNSARLFYRFSF